MLASRAKRIAILPHQKTRSPFSLRPIAIMEVSLPRRSSRTQASVANGVVSPAPASKPRKRASQAAQGSSDMPTKKRAQRISLAEQNVNGSGAASSATASAEASKTPTQTPRKVRTAAIQKTNAPLQTPGGSRLIRLPTAPNVAPDGALVTHLAVEPTSATPVDVNAPVLTTDNLLATAKAHLLSVDPRLRVAIDGHHCNIFDPEGLCEVIEPFAALSSGIIGQQVSGAAATSIKNKFIALFELSDVQKASPKLFPSPAQVAAMDLATLRTAGLSQRKAEYIHGLAQKFASNELSAQMLLDATDEELIEKLVAVRGLGRWSVEMFACFGLKRMDVFSTGDLGVQKGCAVYRGKDVAKLRNKGGKWKYLSEQEMLETAAPFAPYRSLFMWYMWRFADTDVGALK